MINTQYRDRKEKETVSELQKLKTTEKIGTLDIYMKIFVSV